MKIEHLELNQRTLQLTFCSEITNIPHFVDTTKEDHYRAREIAQDLLSLLYILFVDRVISQRKIDQVKIKMICFLSEINKIDYDLGEEYSDYIVRMLKYYEDNAVEMELFEVAANISNLLK